MKVWSIDIKIAATAYIKAETAEEAQRIAEGLKDNGLELFEQDGEIPISGKQYNDPDLPDVSLSPAMTIHGPWDGDKVSEVEDLDEEDGEEDAA